MRAIGVEAAETQRPPKQAEREREERAPLAATPLRATDNACFISYAHPETWGVGEPREVWFDAAHARVEALRLEPVYDRKALAGGLNIDRFIAWATAELPKALLVISGDYLRSADCMAELYRLYQRAEGDAAVFGRMVRAAVLPDAVEIFSDDGRVKLQEYWIGRRDATKAELERLQARKESIAAIEPSYAQYRDFAEHSAAMLRLVARNFCATTIAEIETLDFVADAFRDA